MDFRRRNNKQNAEWSAGDIVKVNLSEEIFQ
jgi:hypothetical protein